MNDLETKTDMRTPIEIALDIDGEGKTTVKKLYAFLELSPSNYSKWCKTNITENEFATENEDYFYSSSSTSEQGRGNFAQDFKLTAHFAKKLCQKQSGEKGEQAREYFTMLEERVKQKAIDFTQLSESTRALFGLIENMAKKEIEDKERDRKIAQAEQTAQKAIESVEATKEAVMPITENWRAEITKKVRKIQYASQIDFQTLQNYMYEELERRAGCKLNTRLRNRKQQMHDNGCLKSKIDAIRKIDIIEEDKKLKEIFSKILSEYEIRYCA